MSDNLGYGGMITGPGGIPINDSDGRSNNTK